MIKIILVDDNELIRDGIRLRLRDVEDIKIIGEASNGVEAINLCRDSKPDVVLMDINMPYIDGLEATRQIKAINPNINILILTSYAQQENIQKAKEYNCSGVIYKEAKIEDFISIIKNVNNGYDVWTKGLLNTEVAMNVVAEPIDISQLDALGKKEIQLISCKVKCMKYSDIAIELNYSEAYTRQLAVQLKDKLGLKSVNELAVWGAKRGL